THHVFSLPLRPSSPPRSLPFFVQGCGHPRALHSFPTRRSSDLNAGQIVLGAGSGLSKSLGALEADAFEAVPRNGLAPFECVANRSEEHTSELQSRFDLVCRLLLEKKKTKL